ncbi:MAG: fused MFS/spermidine synthase [Blastocatellia bacterium]|nr:fused MFS/spermidine synthase [Blastocatellia bacterium]
MSKRSLSIAFLLFGSGMCALIYQTAWLREFRLIFGASTAASAAVLAIFMGGLGVGGILLGKRADTHERPLALYAQLELLIAFSVAVTPALVWLARWGYSAVGGTPVLGVTAGTVVRLCFATLVLCVPTFLMGGTLPAAAKAAETDDDLGRQNLALLYGSNTLGAVTGTVLATFLLLETYGTRLTLWLACLVNVVVALIARNLTTPTTQTDAPPVSPTPTPLNSVAVQSGWNPSERFVLLAAALVGFAFLLMELVWYRMLGPLLGGSTFTFGLILAVALLGIGLGGAAYAFFGRNQPASFAGFAWTCALEALFLAIPFALGDRLAFVAILLRPLQALGFLGQVGGWLVLTVVVVFPAAFISGVQFPLLIALLGRGAENVGKHIGVAYAWNTVGAIVGSLAGGFGLLPLLTAVGTWKLVVVLLSGLALLTVFLPRFLSTENKSHAAGLPTGIQPLVASLVAILLLFSSGPTAAWRHSPIGAGRVVLTDSTRNELRDWAALRRRAIAWESEGIESSVALGADGGYEFIVNGKTDGHTIIDAGTAVMSGLVGAILHPNPKRSLVVGMGVGSSAGWLAAVPTMDRVDVVELEPAILKIARMCGPVNENVMSNPKVHTFLGDAREVLMTTRERYDIIFSEPSNPYRAGIANLFTQDFYRAATARLNDGGFFVQWLQAYESDSGTIRSVYATISSVFPQVETFQSRDGDLLLVASQKPVSCNIPLLEERLKQEPYRRALTQVWRVSSLEGFFARYVGRTTLAQAIARLPQVELNTDDRPVLEFAFARNVGKRAGFDIGELLEVARQRHADRPQLTGGEIDWSQIEDRYASMMVLHRVSPKLKPTFTQPQQIRTLAKEKYVQGKLSEVWTLWRTQPEPARDLVELVMIAEAAAEAGDETAVALTDSLRLFEPIEADVVLARLRARQGRLPEAIALLETAFTKYRSTPWPYLPTMERALDLAVTLGKIDKSAAARFYQALSEPFSLSLLDGRRMAMRFELAKLLDENKPGRFTLETIRKFEPNVPWTGKFLYLRKECYRLANDPQTAQAERDWETFLQDEPVPFAEGLETKD